MNRVNGVLLFAACLMTGSVGYSRTIDHSYEVGTWPGFRSGAVSYTFDDGCSNQLVLAVPMFNEFGFKLTLFTITSQSPDWTALQKAAAQGHEVASHTVTHTSLSGLADEQQTTELKGSQDDINAHVTGRQCITMAYPYCNTGNFFLCGQYYIAARGCQGFIEASTPGDFLNISSLICGNLGSVQTAGSFNANADSTAATKGWCVYLIHGIDNDGGYSPLSSAELRASLQYMDAHRSTIWVSTFGNVAHYVRERDAVSVTESLNEDTRITVQVTHTLDPTIYNYPLTIRRQLPLGWPSARVVQNGQVAAIRTTQFRSVTSIIFDAVPNGGEAVLTKALPAPTGLTATPGDPNIALDWTDNTDANLAGYNVYRSTTSGGAYTRLNVSLLSASNFSDANAAPDTSYYYVVTAVAADANESSYSTEVTARLPVPLPIDVIVEPNDPPASGSSRPHNTRPGPVGPTLDAVPVRSR